MTNRLRLCALAVAAALAACGDSATSTTPGLLLDEPTAVAVFRGRITGADARPYLAIANAGSNDLTIVDALSDEGVPAPVTFRRLVFPVPGRPTLLASATLGDDDPLDTTDDRPDLLVAVSAGDSRLQVVTTWAPDGSVAGEVDLGGDVLALVVVPSDSMPGTARIAAALSGERIAVVTFDRAGTPDDAIDVAGATVAPSGPLGFQPVALAAMPGDEARIWAATLDLGGVAEVDVPAGVAPSVATVLDALAPTRLVAAARLRERGSGAVGLDPQLWTTVERVYAVLDESGCGDADPIACGLVALDPAAGGLAPDFVDSNADRAPIAIPGRALALAASGPPALPPSTAPADQVYAPPFMRIFPGTGARQTTGVAAVASSDGALYFVDLGRWEIPSNQVVWKSVRATVTAARAPGAGSAVDQWLVLVDPANGTTVAHTDPTGLSSAVTLTPGYTPTDRWTVTHEGVLPGLSARRAEAGYDGAPWLALQVQIGSGQFGEVVHLEDPEVGVRAGDTVVIDPSGASTTLTSCTAPFEAEVGALLAPTGQFPGGAARLVKKVPGEAAWDDCVDALTGSVAGLRATIRAGGADPYVLVRGTGAAAAQVGRPQLGTPFDVTTRRISYVAEECSADPPDPCPWPGLPDVVGPALSFTLALETGAEPPRDLALVIDTAEGRAHFRVAPVGVDARAVATFDRSPYPNRAAAGVRFLVPYASGVVLDATPTLSGGNAKALR